MMSLGAALSCLSGGLISNYNEVLEEAPFSPLDLSPVLWFDASDASTITQSAGAVSQWDDKSGNALHATQGTGSNQPTFNTDELVFTGTHWLNLPDLSAYFNGSQNRTIFVVGEVDTVSSDEGFFSLGPNTTGNKFPIMTNLGALRLEITGSGATTSLSMSVDTYAIIALKLDGTTLGDCTYYLNGTSEAVTGANTINTDASNTNSIGRVALGDKLNGAIREIIAFDSALSDADLNQVGNYLENKWALTWTDL